MPNDPATTKGSDLLAFSVLCGGQDVTGLYEVVAVEVSAAVNRIPAARIVIRDGDAPLGDFPASESESFAPGTKVQIKAGYNSKTDSLFEGIIVKQSLRHRRGGMSQLTVECRASAIKMTAARKSTYYKEQTDSELLAALIKKNGLQADVASTSPQLPWVTQFNASDWDFLVIRAQVNGLLVIAGDKKISVKAPDWSQEPAVGATYGDDILELNVELDAATQLAGVECSAWDAATQKMLAAMASAGDINTLGGDKTSTLANVLSAGTVKLASAAPLTQAELAGWAKAAVLKSELSKIRGRLLLQGNALAVVGSLIKVKGLGKRFDGNGFIGGVTHEIKDGNWTTDVALGDQPTWFATEAGITPAAASAQLPPVQGLQVGVVEKIDADPAGGLRVRVKLPAAGSQDAVVWARLGGAYATKAAGSFFYPEVDDEVVLGFLDNDPRFAVILGSLHSKARAAAYTPDTNNTQKAIVTNAKLRVLFDDKNKVLTFQTPGNNQLVLSDLDKAVTLSDQNGNTLKLSKTGIELTSVCDIVMKASKNVTGEAQAGTWSIKGTQGVSVAGLKVSLEADTQFSAKGNATASIQSSGQTTVKGAMVMIN